MSLIDKYCLIKNRLLVKWDVDWMAVKWNWIL